MRRFLPVLVAVAAGCFITDPLTTSHEERLDEARERWAAAALDSYTFRYSRSCECVPEAAGPAEVFVVNGAVSEVELDSGGTPIIEAYPTIDTLFEEIAEVLAQHPVQFAASYHPELGYPMAVSTDIDLNVADEEFSVQVSNLAPRFVSARGR